MRRRRGRAGPVAGADEHVLRPGGAVHEVPLPQRALLALDDEQRLAREHEEVLLIGLPVVHRHRLARPEHDEVDPDLREVRVSPSKSQTRRAPVRWRHAHRARSGRTSRRPSGRARARSARAGPREPSSDHMQAWHRRAHTARRLGHRRDEWEAGSSLPALGVVLERVRRKLPHLVRHQESRLADEIQRREERRRRRRAASTGRRAVRSRLRLRRPRRPPQKRSDGVPGAEAQERLLRSLGNQSGFWNRGESSGSRQRLTNAPVENRASPIPRAAENIHYALSTVSRIRQESLAEARRAAAIRTTGAPDMVAGCESVERQRGVGVARGARGGRRRSRGVLCGDVAVAVPRCTALLPRHERERTSSRHWGRAWPTPLG